MVNIDALSLLSDHKIDKIVQHDTVTIVNPGGAGTTDFDQANIVTDTRPNTYGKACLARARWSIDGGATWQGMHTKLVYTFTLTSFGVVLNGLDSAISIGCNASTVFFRTANGRHGNVAGNPPSSYTPTSRTFTIEYWLYEVE